MRDVTLEEVLNNYTYWKRACLISGIKKPISRRSLNKLLGDTSNNIYLISLLKFLEKGNYIFIDRTVTPNLIKVDNIKLSSELLYHGEISKQIELLVKLNNPLGMYNY